MDVNISTIVLSVVSSGAFAAVVTALVNGWLNHKTQIQAIKESGLYAKRGEVFDALMSQIENLDNMMSSLLSPVGPYDPEQKIQTQAQEEIGHTFNNFVRYFLTNRHYLPKDLCQSLGNLQKEYKDLYVDFSVSVRPVGEKTIDHKLWAQLFYRLKNELPIKKEEIANTFRKLVGVK